jgi:hypothetical protein
VAPANCAILKGKEIDTRRTMNINETRHVSRKEFLSIMGGAVAVLALGKFVGAKTAVSTVLGRKAASGYGSSTYGG